MALSNAPVEALSTRLLPTFRSILSVGSKLVRGLSEPLTGSSSLRLLASPRQFFRSSQPLPVLTYRLSA